MIELDEKKRIIQEFVPGKQVTLAHVIGKPDPSVYTNLCLEIGFHADFDQEGRAIGILQLSPAESAADCTATASVCVKRTETVLNFAKYRALLALFASLDMWSPPTRKIFRG